MAKARIPWLWLPAAAAAVGAQAWLWRTLAPAAKCYLWEGDCVFQVSGSSSPYFVRDLTFGAIGLALGVLLGLLFGGRLWRGGPVLQVGFAALGAAASYGACRLGVIGSEIVAIDDRVAYDRLTLGAVGLILAWPLGTQLIVWVRGVLSRS